MAESTGKIHIPRRGTHGARVGELMLRALRPFAGFETSRYQRVTTPEPARFMGFPVLVLTTIGARSGKERNAVLGAFPESDNAWLIIGSKSGAASNPNWLYNLARNPDRIWAQVGNRKFRANVESLQGKERDDAYARVATAAPQYGGYRDKTDREIPVLRVTPA